MYKTLSKADLPRLIGTWQEHATIVAPVRNGELTEFRRLNGTREPDLYFGANTRYPPKALFLPQSEAMFHVQGVDFEPIQAEISSRVILGIRACDARAVQLLDGVFDSPEHKDPYWVQRRERTTMVVLGCANPCATCFCTTVGSGPFDARGADILLTEVGDDYVAEFTNEKGEALMGHLPNASRAQIRTLRQVQEQAAANMDRPFQTEGIVDKLYQLFDSDFWFQVQQSCLGCGVCTMLCPTCHCFDIADEVQRSERVRNWDTCMFRIYSQEASGHNPRPTNVERTRQRIMHKYAYFVESFGEIGCTGCGRCVRHCPVALDIRDIIRSAQSRAEP
jgi:sulfhydrogenase subunit beta (sulfur reductase)